MIIPPAPIIDPYLACVSPGLVAPRDHHIKFRHSRRLRRLRLLLKRSWVSLNEKVAVLLKVQYLKIDKLRKL